MNKKKITFFLIVPILVIITVLIIVKSRQKKDTEEVVRQISPAIGSIQNTFSTTASVLPKNRLEVKPPVNGRIEQILVQEGDKVEIGQTLAWMSSTERAALLDAARGQGQEKLEYWEQVYKSIALLATINGEVIVATTQPGQTVTTAEAVVVLSDQLIVRAQVDETDIGKVKPKQKAMISLDAYPDTKIKGAVEHIYYESKTVNNVTIYEVDLIPEKISSFFRSGMNASVSFVRESRENILLIPLEAAQKDNGVDFVMLKRDGEKEAVRQVVKLGIADDKDVEVLSGLNKDDKIIIKSKKYALPKSDIGSNPFLPSRRNQPSR